MCAVACPPWYAALTPPSLSSTNAASNRALACFPRLKLYSSSSNSSIISNKAHLARQQQASTYSKRVLFARAEAGLSEFAPTAAAVYGSLLLSGGLFAYTRSASKGSLIGGLTGGALLALVFFLMRSPDTKYLGDAIGFGTSFLFIAIFGIRLAATRKTVPAAPLLLLSIAASAIFVGAYLQDKGI